MKQPVLISVEEILLRYEGILFDAFGVLLRGHEGIPGAINLIRHLNEIRFPYWVVTNGSCYSSEKTAESYQKRGLDIRADRVITSGSLVAPWLREKGLEGARLRILGPPSSFFMAREADCLLTDGDDFDVLIISNQNGYPLLETMDHVISVLFRRIDKGNSPLLLLPNPDLLYPAAQDSYGVTSGMVARIIESALNLRYGKEAPCFVRLGKPYAPIFEEALRRAAHLKLVMIGDQPETDIRGANDIGLDSVLVESGISRMSMESLLQIAQPSFYLPSL
ncbi:MAG: HAD hydrolase-like protein [Deltaproteobacteria bacterium]|nr:HAD hydrolase-like protein [Deltaproteobacteria bacterium]